MCVCACVCVMFMDFLDHRIIYLLPIEASGSAVSKISSTLAELRAMNEARNRRRREVRQYLSSDSVPRDGGHGELNGDFLLDVYYG